MFMLPSVALGENDSTCQQYNPQLCTTVGGVVPPTPTGTGVPVPVPVSTPGIPGTGPATPGTGPATPPIGPTSLGTSPGASPTKPGAVFTALPTTTNPTVTLSSATLPFTGLDVALLVAGGGALLACGLVMRRLSRRVD
jgi:hypothetical protein